MKRGYRPQRTCLGCGARNEQSALLRIVERAGELCVDRLAEGRGAYLHRREECWGAFVRKKSLYRALRVEVGREAKQRLVQALRDHERQ